MGRPRTGSVVPFVDEQGRHRFKIGITLPNGQRSFKRLPPGTSEERAKATAESWNEKAGNDPTLLGQPDAPQGETVAAWFARWADDRKLRGLSTVSDDCSRFRIHVETEIGAKAMVAVQRADLETVVDKLDSKVRAGSLSWKSAVNTWGVVSKMFDDACSSKNRTLRVRDDNPAAGVRGPDRGIRKAKSYLYPSEFLQIMTCKEDVIPLETRRAIALAVYTYTRASELRALTWNEADAERGIIHVHQSEKREGERKSTKTGLTRRFAAEPTLLPLLRAMHKESKGTGRIIDLPDDRHLARELRRVLEKAGITRAELFADDLTRKPITWHDLRATGLTWMAIRGDDPLKIMQRAGHTDFKTTQGYVREAEAVREGFGNVFPVLPASLLASIDPGNDPGTRGGGSNNSKSNRKKLWRRRESNPSGTLQTAGNADICLPRESERPALAIDNYAKAGERIASGSEADPIERALAVALEVAAAKGDLTTILAVAAELKARREARAGVAVLGEARARRGGGR